MIHQLEDSGHTPQVTPDSWLQPAHRSLNKSMLLTSISNNYLMCAAS
jgi:hypothetical protein